MVEFHVNSKTTTIPLGRQGENLARVIYFDLAEMIKEYGEGTATLMNKRVGDDLPYKCTTTQSGDLLAWMPNSTDTAYAGTGKCELRWVVGNVLAKSITYKATITPSITADTDLPAPYQTWYESLLAEISEYTIASADIAKNKSDIAKNKNDISTCKTNIATNTAAITALNSSAYLLNGATPIADNSDLNTYITPGNYQVAFAASGATISNMPTNTAGVLRVEKSGYASNNYKRQTFYEFNNSYRHIRYTNDNGNTWSTWAKVPTRADIDALTNRSALTVTIASNDIDPEKSNVSAFKCGNITIITGYFYVTTQLATNSNMFQISGNGYTSPYRVIFALAGSNGNSISRLKLESNTVKSDDAFSANKYYSFEIVFA